MFEVEYFYEKDMKLLNSKSDDTWELKDTNKNIKNEI